MTILIFATVLAAALGLILPPRWGVWGFLAAVVLVFVTQAGINFARGFEGTSLEESLLLFNNSWGAYLGYNLQITYRAFALPLLVLSAITVFRVRRA